MKSFSAVFDMAMAASNVWLEAPITCVANFWQSRGVLKRGSAVGLLIG